MQVIKLAWEEVLNLVCKFDDLCQVRLILVNTVENGRNACYGLFIGCSQQIKGVDVEEVCQSVQSVKTGPAFATLNPGNSVTLNVDGIGKLFFGHAVLLTESFHIGTEFLIMIITSRRV